MRYVSTRDNHPAAPSSRAIDLGMVPEGGLFVPQTVPHLDLGALSGATYQHTARVVLGSLLTDFSADEIERCVAGAYGPSTFDAPGIIELATLDSRRFVMELWHGPTAAFKDVALQAMPHFMECAKAHEGQKAHTVILVATSGDTGKAALEGFRDRPGVSIIVFYPENGVSEIQRLQMATTEGSNTHVIAVRGNFDDCQNGVKELFGDTALARRLAASGMAFSSANSINWGRLCPQIVYYVQSYLELERRNAVRMGAPVDFCVPTGNFGNILAGYYAKLMGVPIRRLICASNRNRVLADFFATGTYDRKREFFRTMSPSMDILISSNLERFLFEMTGHDAARVGEWYAQLAAGGAFSVDERTKVAMGREVVAAWVDEDRVLATIGDAWRRYRYVLDTHTAVGMAVCNDIDDGQVPVIVDATASPYKFSGSVLEGLGGGRESDEFRSIERLRSLTGLPVHRALASLRDKPIRHSRVIDVDGMAGAVGDITSGIRRG